LRGYSGEHGAKTSSTAQIEANSALRMQIPSPTIGLRSSLLTINEETRVALTCPSCGNDQNFLVKTLQMHVVHLDDSRVEVSEEGRPAVLEVLCDECETALSIDDMEEGLRKELLLTLGAR
jgi:hypothetical protein